MGVLMLWTACTPNAELNTVPLDRGWEFQDTAGAWRPAEVPGSIHTDLMSSGLIPDPFEGQNEQAVQWVEGLDWQYRCPLPLPPETGEWALEFAGVDTHAEIQVNGRVVLQSDNMHRSWRIPKRDLPLTGADTLFVTLLSPVRQGQLRLDASPWPIPASNEDRPIGQQTSAVTRKAMHHFGWDWGPRLATSGLWKPVRWVRTDVELPSFRLCADTVDAMHAVFRVLWDAPVSGVEGELFKDGLPVNFTWTSLDSSQHQFSIPSPELWWPNGMGEQPLYELRLDDGEGRQTRWRFGVRTVTWNRAKDTHGHAMQCVVNGVPVQMRGANVIPPDAFPVRAASRWGRVIDDAVAANMNMLRVWGGAHYGDEVFYDLCDEQGLLVWQDFMNACAMVPGDEPWRMNFLAEAEAQVVRLRNRTSLAIWAGNNETEKAWRDWGWQDLYGLHGEDSVAVEEAYRKVFERALPALVDSLGGGEYQPSSPHALDPQNPGASGDQHDWGVWFGKAGFDYYTDEAGRFSSEFGLQSLPDPRTLREVGVQSWEDPALQFRQRCSMDWLEPGFDGWDMMQHYASVHFADPEAVDWTTIGSMDELDGWVYLSQLTQAEGLRQAIERHRCSAGRTSGSLYWQLDDVWPTVSWSTVDHAGRWKLAHHAVRHANAPLRLLPDRAQSSWRAFNLGPDQCAGAVEWVHVHVHGDTLRSGAFPLALGPFSTESMVPMPWMEEGVIAAWRWTTEEGRVLDAGVFCPSPVVALDWPDAEIQLVTGPEGVKLTTNVPAAGVWLRSEREGRFEDNGFFLLPGQAREVRFVDVSGEFAHPGEVSLVHFAQLPK